MTASARKAEPLAAASDERPVLRWHEDRDDRRLRRVAEILADILDNKTTPGDGAGNDGS